MAGNAVTVRQVTCAQYGKKNIINLQLLIPWIKALATFVHICSVSCFVWLHPEVCEKDGYHMTWAVKLVQQICKVFSTTPEKFCFIQQLENMFSEVTREFFEFSVAGEVGQLSGV